MQIRSWYVVLGLLLAFHLQRAETRRRRYKDCPEERLKVRESAADVVLTGVVKRLFGVQEDKYGGEVLVKRVVKGDHIKAGESLLVEGFGNTDICTSKVIAKDSKVFLLNQLQTGRFKLNSSLLQINIPNLEKITAAVKGIPYRKRSPIPDEPCEKKYCRFNGECYEENHRASCRCVTSCREHYDPVCGSDGLTYNTECHMKVDSCRKKKRIYIRHEGLCSRSK